MRRRRWISASRSASCPGSARQVLAQRAGVERVEPARQAGAELDRLGAQRAGQRRVLVLQVAGDERPDAVGASAAAPGP